MKTLLIILAALILFGCTTIEIKPDGTVICNGVRKCSVATREVVVVSGEILLNQDSVQILGKQLIPDND